MIEGVILIKLRTLVQHVSSDTKLLLFFPQKIQLAGEQKVVSRKVSMKLVSVTVTQGIQWDSRVMSPFE